METSTIVILIALTVLILLIVYTQLRATSTTTENFEEPVYVEDESVPSMFQPSDSMKNIAEYEIEPSDLSSSTTPMGAPMPVPAAAPVPTDEGRLDMPSDKIKVEDLLPKDAANSKWAQANPAGQGDIDSQNYLTAGHLIGVNTVGPSLRNANMQLRSDPPIERVDVGPWSQTTIEYDVNRRFFEIGQC